MSKINGDKLSINKKNIDNFFEKRAINFNKNNPLTTILYQDNHPEIAYRRDLLERERVTPLLNLTGTERVLDVGCGIGRWGATIANQVSEYHGIDASPSLIDLAKSYCAYGNTYFHVIGVDDLTSSWLSKYGPFDRVICSGILIYLDDTQLSKLLNILSESLAPNALVYVREPMGIQGRLTLSDHWSDELQAYYNAIYRSPAEIVAALATAFPELSYRIDPITLLFEETELNNRTETRQHFCIIRKK